MGSVKDTVVYIGHDVYDHLPKKEQKHFEWHSRYKPEWISQIFDDVQDDTQPTYKEEETWENHNDIFTDVDDYEDFWGEDWDNTGGSTYKRIWNDMTFKDEKYYEDLAKQISGNQLRVLFE